MIATESKTYTILDEYIPEMQKHYNKANNLYYDNHELVLGEDCEEQRKVVENINDELEKVIQIVVPEYRMKDKSFPHFPLITLHVDVRPGERRAPPASFQHWIPDKEYTYNVDFHDIELNHKNKTHNVYAVGGGMYEVKRKKVKKEVETAKVKVGERKVKTLD